MDKRTAVIVATLAFAALAPAVAPAQVEPTVELCEAMGVLRVAWLNFETQDLTAPRSKVDQAAAQVSAALDQMATLAESARPAAFDQLKQAHDGVEVVIAAVPEDAAPAQVQDRIASAKDNERVAYQNLVDSIVCP